MVLVQQVGMVISAEINLSQFHRLVIFIVYCDINIQFLVTVFSNVYGKCKYYCPFVFCENANCPRNLSWQQHCWGILKKIIIAGNNKFGGNLVFG